MRPKILNTGILKERTENVRGQIIKKVTQENFPESMIPSFQIESPTNYPTQRMRTFTKFQDTR